MLTLLGSLLGFLTSAVPSLIKLFQDKQDKKHELALLEKQAELNIKLGELKFEAAQLQTDTQVLQMAYQFADPFKVSDRDIYKSFKSIVYLLTSSVRPVVTYLFLLGYLFFKWQLFIELKDYKLIWTEDDMALFAGVISFWFGSREISKRFK